MERRKHFLINKPLQFRYMAYITLTLLIVSVVVLVSLYVGIWSSVLKAFSDATVRHDMTTAARISQYEQARYNLSVQDETFSPLTFFKQAEKLSVRQREVFKEILNNANHDLSWKLIILFFFIAWGSIYVTHKVAGPLFRSHMTLQHLQKGDLTTRVYLRKFDEGQFLVNDFNGAISYLDQRISTVKKLLHENKKTPDKLPALLEEELSKIKTSGE